ncbi:hypothetical protein MASSI9I_80073 [Massilia sp. 9I]|nr:hypothetical protein MASSI9I_80073 [Massilia sp. 9I]
MAGTGAPAPGGLHARLLQAYGEPQRHYHTLQHLDECLVLAEALRVTSVTGVRSNVTRVRSNISTRPLP